MIKYGFLGEKLPSGYYKDEKINWNYCVVYGIKPYVKYWTLLENADHCFNEIMKDKRVKRIIRLFEIKYDTIGNVSGFELIRLEEKL